MTDKKYTHRITYILLRQDHKTGLMPKGEAEKIADNLRKRCQNVKVYKDTDEGQE